MAALWIKQSCSDDYKSLEFLIRLLKKVHAIHFLSFRVDEWPHCFTRQPLLSQDWCNMTIYLNQILKINNPWNDICKKEGFFWPSHRNIRTVNGVFFYSRDSLVTEPLPKNHTYCIKGASRARGKLENTRRNWILRGRRINKSSFFKQQDSPWCIQGKQWSMYISLAPYDDRRRTKWLMARWRSNRHDLLGCFFSGAGTRTCLPLKLSALTLPTLFSPFIRQLTHNPPSPWVTLLTKV